MTTENIKRTIVWAYLATGGAQVFELLFNYVLYKLIPVAEIGVYSWAAALVVFFNVAVDMGIEPILVRKFGHREFSLSNAFRVIMVLRLPLIALGALLLAAVYAYGILTLQEFWVLLLVGAHTVFNVFDGVARAWLRANSRQTAANFIASLQSGLKLVAIAALYFLLLNSILYVLVFLLLIRLVGSILLCTYAYNGQRNQTGDVPGPFSLAPVAGNLLRTGMSVGGISLLTAAQNRLDWLLISSWLSATALASYALANKLYEITQVLIGVSLTTLYPWLCRRDEQSEFRLLLLVRGIVFVGVLISVGGILLVPWLIGLLFGDKYFGVELPAQLMMLSAGIIAVSGVYYQVALSKGFEKQLLAMTVVTTSVQLLSNLYCIPRLGLAGGAAGMLVLQLMTAGCLMAVVLNNKLIAPAIVSRIMTFVSLFLLLSALMIYLRGIAWYALPVIAAVISGTGWFVLFQQEERRYLMSHFHVVVQSIKKSVFS